MSERARGIDCRRSRRRACRAGGRSALGYFSGVNPRVAVVRRDVVVLLVLMASVGAAASRRTTRSTSTRRQALEAPSGRTGWAPTTRAATC